MNTEAATLNTETVTLKAKTYRANYDYSKDAQCACCARPISYRSAVAVLLVSAPAITFDGRTGRTGTEGGEAVFAPIADMLGTEPAEWASVVGSSCAKQLSKEYRTPMRRAGALFLKANPSG